MRPRSMFLLSLVFAASAAMAQTAPTSPSSPTSNSASAPAPKPVATPASSAPTLVNSPGMLHQANPAAAAVQPRSEAGATERGLNATGTAGTATGVTQRVQHANAHGVDVQGHTLDAHGKPVGQAAVPMPAPATTVH